MRLPRIRFTVGTLLISIAVVAMNCWGFRRLTETPRYVFGITSYRLLPASVGVLPLFNAALIGVWSLATKRRRLRRHACGERPASPWSGATFLSLHFLVLGYLVSAFSPEAARIAEDLLDVATECAAKAWEAVLGEPGETIAWLTFESLILGAFLSGPPLLVSWIGRALATRCAAAMPRFRFRLMTCLVSLGFASADLAIALTPQPFEGEQDLDLEIQVVDRDSGRPIIGAFTRVTDPFDPTVPPPGASTDVNGRARMTGRFVASGERNAFRTMGVCSPWGRWLEVSAAGRRTRRIPLAEVLGPAPDLDRPCLGLVALDAGATPEDALRDLAGTYEEGGGFGGSSLKIEPDGRFAWVAWGCTSLIREYGYLKRHGGQIELAPVPHPGEAIHPLMFQKFREIRWGERLYLSMADERGLREFCREALTPKGLLNAGRRNKRYLRRSDRDKPQTGLPRLPMNAWVGYLVDEMDLNNERGRLRLALDSLRSRVRRQLPRPDHQGSTPSARSEPRPSDQPPRGTEATREPSSRPAALTSKGASPA